MAFNRPTLVEIQDRALADLQSNLGSGPLLKNSFIGALVKSIAGGLHLLYGYLSYIAKMALPDTAEGEYLNRWSSIWGVNRAAATFASGNVTFTGTNTTVIPAGTIIQSATGVQFTTDAEATIAAGSATIAVTATIAGASGNLEATTAVTLLSPIAGVNSSGVVATGGLTGGTDQEVDSDLQARLIQRIQNPPQGGSVTDYERWALEVSGVSRAFVFPQYDGAGTVGVAILGADNAIPDSGTVAATQAYIDDETRRPVTANVTVYAPAQVDVDFTLSISPDTEAVRTAVENSLKSFLQRDAAPGATLYLSKIREAVSIAAGEIDNTVTVPSANLTYTNGQMPVFGAITWS